MAEKFTTAKEFDGFLKVNSCGKQLLSDRDYNTLREQGRVDYSVHYIKKGRGYYEHAGQIHTIPEGSILLFPPRVRQHIFFKKEDSSEMWWSHFSGSACDIIKECGSEAPCVIEIKDKKHFETAAEKMIKAYYIRQINEDMLSEGFMFFILTLIKESLENVSAVSGRSLNFSLKMVLSDMSINFNKPIDLKKYATMCHLSEDSFIRMFKKNMGCPPYRYQLKIRIERAVELLENSGMNVCQCGEAVGFPDNAYFCRIFKKFTGHTPSYYKK